MPHTHPHKCRVVFHKRISLPQVASRTAKATARGSATANGAVWKKYFSTFGFWLKIASKDLLWFFHDMVLWVRAGNCLDLP